MAGKPLLLTTRLRRVTLHTAQTFTLALETLATAALLAYRKRA
jgi:hypothetical protein